MKKLIVLALSVGIFSASFAQPDPRTRETIIADVIMQLPANNPATHNQLMGELLRLGNVIDDLALRLTDSGGDEQLRLAISGMAVYASSDAANRAIVAKSICDAISVVQSNTVREFLFVQLQHVAGAESQETALQYLNNARFRKFALHTLAVIADPSSERILYDAARAADYREDPADALQAYVLFLRNNIPARATDVRRAANRLLGATSENTQFAAKTAALELLTLSVGERAISDITRALRSNNKEYRQAALKFSQNIQSPRMYRELARAAGRERRPEVKAEIIIAFGERGDIEAWSFVQNSLADSNGEVRSAAIVAADKIAKADNTKRSEVISHIVMAMNTNDERVIATGKNTIMSFDTYHSFATISGTPPVFSISHYEDEYAINEVAAAVPNATPQAKVAFLEILAAKKAVSLANVVFEQTSSPDANVRLAAYRALSGVVSENDMQRVVQMLNTATDDAEIRSLQRALFASFSEKTQDEQTDIVAELATSSNNPAKYGGVLALIGGQRALDMVMDHGFNSGNANLRETAFEALLDWSDELGMRQLYRIAAAEPRGQYFDRALTGYINKVNTLENTPEQRLILLRSGLEIAQTPTHKQNILHYISCTGTFIGLLTAGAYLDDANNDVQQAAVQTVRTIALENPEYYGSVVAEILIKAIEVNRHTEAESQRLEIWTHLLGLPTDEGFVSMFNGIDLTGWKGLVEDPIRRARMTPEQLAQRQVRADEIMRRDWTVQNGILVFDGPAYDNLCSEKDYGDFEMYVDWRIGPRGDSGLYLRGSPQVQIWDDSQRAAPVGSGGLFNNQIHPRNPLVIADNPVGEWNSFYLKMIGDKVTIYLNGVLVTDEVILENFWNRDIPIFDTGAIELQAHTTRTEFRDIYIREIPRPEPYEVPEAEQAEGFVPMFNGIDLTGWTGDVDNYFVRNGAIVSHPVGHGNLYTEKEYSDFVMRFDFKLTPAANNGIGIRSTRRADNTFRLGMELQILDDDAPVYSNLDGYQYHGSVYGVIPARRGALNPVGEWNTQEIVFDGYRVKITLNGTLIVDGDLAEASANFTRTIDGEQHPGLANTSGHIGILAHDAEVEFRNMRIRELR